MVRLLNSPSGTNFQPSSVMNAASMIQSALIPIIEARARQSEIKARQKAENNRYTNSLLADTISNLGQDATGVIYDMARAQQQKNEDAFLKDFTGSLSKVGNNVDTQTSPDAGNPYSSAVASITGVPIAGGVQSSPIGIGKNGAIRIDRSNISSLLDSLEKIHGPTNIGRSLRQAVVSQQLGSLFNPKSPYDRAPWYMAPGVPDDVRNSMLDKETYIKPDKETDPSLVALREQQARESASREAKNRAGAAGTVLSGLGKGVGNAWKESGAGQVFSSLGDVLGVMDPKKRAEIANLNARTDEAKKRTAVLGTPKPTDSAKSDQTKLNNLTLLDKYWSGKEEELNTAIGNIDLNLEPFEDVPDTPGKIYGKNPGYVGYRQNNTLVRATPDQITQRGVLQKQRDTLQSKLSLIQAKRDEFAQQIEELTKRGQGSGDFVAEAAGEPTPGQAAAVGGGHDNPVPESSPGKGISKATPAHEANDVSVKDKGGVTASQPASGEQKYYDSLPADGKAFVDSYSGEIRKRAIRFLMGKNGANQ